MRAPETEAEMVGEDGRCLCQKLTLPQKALALIKQNFPLLAAVEIREFLVIRLIRPSSHEMQRCCVNLL